MATARLTITCADQPGIVAAVGTLLHRHGANITALDQHSTDPAGGRFFMRVEFAVPEGAEVLQTLAEAVGRELAGPFGARWRLHDAAARPRVLLLASKQDHALLELLWRWRRGELPCELIGVAANHRTLQTAVQDFGLPFYHVAFAPQRRTEAEAELLERLESPPDLFVLARFMQILSPAFVNRFPNRIINIHHSFLPAFVGANPYRRAYERGVKLIGATAHYVTAELDEGPIIEQDVTRVDHRRKPKDLVELGREIERRVLARAVRWHLEDRILVHENRTIVFA